MREGRTHRTIQNAKVSLLFFLLQIFVGFYSRKIFLDYLGAEVLGMNTTLSNIIGFINLAEMGIGMAMASALYEPLFRKDYAQINDMMSVQGYLYRKIAYLFLIVSIPLCGAFPFLFQNITFPLWYVYATYFICLWGIIANYCWNYREILINADQKNYKLIPYVNGGRLIKTLLQVFLLLYVNGGYLWWLVVELIYNTVITFVINYLIKREYPWLNISLKNSGFLLTKYNYLVKMSKQVFFHKFSGYILTESSPLIIYAYVSLSMVTYYGNYMMLVGYCVSFLNSIFVGLGASVGNLVAENNKSHIMEVFWELFTSRIWLAAVAAFSLFVFIPPFITLWLGEEYLLSNTSFILIMFYMFVRISRSAIESFKDAYKLFGDIWAPIIEACMNLSLSLLFGYYWGLEGILLGMNISLVLIILMWKPYYVYKYGFKEPLMPYIKNYIIHFLILLLSCFVIYIAVKRCVSFSAPLSYVDLFFQTFIYSVLYFFLSMGLLYIFTPGMKMFVKRILKLLQKNR